MYLVHVHIKYKHKTFTDFTQDWYRLYSIYYTDLPNIDRHNFTSTVVYNVYILYYIPLPHMCMRHYIHQFSTNKLGDLHVRWYKPIVDELKGDICSLLGPTRIIMAPVKDAL